MILPGHELPAYISTKKPLPANYAGVGRPAGVKNKSTLIKEVVKKDFDQKVLRLSERLFNAQASIAVGQQFLYKIEKEWIKTGEENGYWKNKKPVLVVSQDEIESYLGELAENNGSLEDDKDDGATYYFLTTKEPNNSAIEALRDRTFGKAKESIEMSGDVKFSLKGLAQRRNKVIDATVVEPKELPSPENPTD